MYNFVHVYSDKKRSINVSIPYYIYGKSNRKNNLFVQLNKIMRIGTPQKEVKKPLFTLFYILFSLIVSNLLCQRRFYGDTVSMPITSLPSLSIIMMSNTAIVFFVTKQEVLKL